MRNAAYTKKAGRYNWAPCPADAALRSDVTSMVNAMRAWHSAQVPQPMRIILRIQNILPFDAADKALIDAAANLAAEPNNNAFHNNRHFLEVFSLTAFLARHAHNEGRITTHDAALLLVSALVHDYRHDGGTNGTNQYRLERLAIDGARPRLAMAGATAADLEKIEACVLATDVSRDFSNPDSTSPSDSLKRYAASGNPADLKPELAAIHQHGFADAALMLHDADLTSGGLLAPDLCANRGRDLAREAKQPYTPQTALFFFDKIAHRRMFSQSGQALFGTWMRRTMSVFSARMPSARP